MSVLVGKQGFEISRINDEHILIAFQCQQVFITGNNIIGLRGEGTGDSHMIIRISTSNAIFSGRLTDKTLLIMHLLYYNTLHHQTI